MKIIGSALWLAWMIALRSSSTPLSIQLVKFNTLTAEAVDKVNNRLLEVMPDRNETLSIYSVDVVNLYRDSRKFRDQVLVGGSSR